MPSVSKLSRGATRSSSKPTATSIRSWPGMRSANLIKTGDQSYCIIGEWDDMDSMAAARPNMIATLDSFRDTLEELDDGNVTDPVSGPVVLELK